MASPTTWKKPPASSLRARTAHVYGGRLRSAAIVFAAALAAAACSGGGPAALTDQVGNAVPVVASGPVVALAPDVTELAFALGAGNRLTATSKASDFPPAARSLPRVDVNDAEAIVALQPALVLATTAGNDPRVVERVRDAGTPVCSVDVTSLDRLLEACRLLGRVLGRPADGAALAAGLAARCAAADAAAAALPRRRALYVVWWDPLIVAAPGTFHDDLLAHARLDNLAPRGAGRYPQVSREILLDPRLEIVVSPDEPDARAGYRSMLDTPAGRRLAAGRIPVVWVPADLANRPGPRLVGALEDLVAARRRLP